MSGVDWFENQTFSGGVMTDAVVPSGAAMLNCSSAVPPGGVIPAPAVPRRTITEVD